MGGSVLLHWEIESFSLWVSLSPNQADDHEMTIMMMMLPSDIYIWWNRVAAVTMEEEGVVSLCHKMVSEGPTLCQLMPHNICSSLDPGSFPYLNQSRRKLVPIILYRLYVCQAETSSGDDRTSWPGSLLSPKVQTYHQMDSHDMEEGSWWLIPCPLFPSEQHVAKPYWLLLLSATVVVPLHSMEHCYDRVTCL